MNEILKFKVINLLKLTLGGTLNPKARPTFCRSRFATSNISFKL